MVQPPPGLEADPPGFGGVGEQGSGADGPPDGDGEMGEELPRGPPHVEMPPAAIARDHILSGHVVYRPWCPSCVVGRARAAPHRSVQGDVAHEVCWDYAEFGPIGAKRVILVAKCTATQMLGATEVTEKGVSWYALLWGKGFVESLGCRRFTMRADNEASLTAYLDGLQHIFVAHDVLRKTSPEGDPQANGLAERAVQEVKGLMRTVRHDLLVRLG